MKQEYHLYLFITHAAPSARPSSLNVRVVNPNSHPTSSEKHKLHMKKGKICSVQENHQNTQL